MRLLFWRRPPAHPLPARRWTWLGGRRILTNTPYVLPKDQAEGDRLDLQHYLLKIAAGGLYRAPIRQTRAILDVATGTGIWAREMALEFPNARVIGFDIDRTPLERSLEVLGPGGQFPTNFSFQMADALKPFPFEDGAFDFVHGRLMSPFIPKAQWPHVASEMMRVLRPGGHIELVDMERPPVSSSESYYLIERAIAGLMERRGLYVGVGDDLLEHLQRAGARRVQQRKFLLGSGRQREREQRLLATDILSIQANMKVILVRSGAFSEEQFDAVYQRTKAELMQVGIVMPIVFCFGMKP
ncbi:MAG TPA: class I SAM-dependent methyltransferase [Ktedonobacterales bacterium]|jgi:ubiquinone/menaquinone biosynthesis C-methylase UbiE